MGENIDKKEIEFEFERAVKDTQGSMRFMQGVLPISS